MFLLLSFLVQVCCHLAAMSAIAETLAKTNHWNYLAQYSILKVMAVITLAVIIITSFSVCHSLHLFYLSCHSL